MTIARPNTPVQNLADEGKLEKQYSPTPNFDDIQNGDCEYNNQAEPCNFDVDYEESLNYRGFLEDLPSSDEAYFADDEPPFETGVNEDDVLALYYQVLEGEMTLDEALEFIPRFVSTASIAEAKNRLEINRLENNANANANANDTNDAKEIEKDIIEVEQNVNVRQQNPSISVANAVLSFGIYNRERNNSQTAETTHSHNESHIRNNI